LKRVIGLDIGGANLKAATADGESRSQSFEIWKAPERLPHALKTLLAELPAADVLAVTMTAELADCFTTKGDGVAQILQGVAEVAGSRPVYVWQTTGEFVAPAQAVREPLRVAAANWHALATWAGRWLPEPASLLVDIGTTTTDIIPLRGGVPVPRGLTDRERLSSGELVYSGVRRTPLCALALAVPFRGDYCPLAAEWFATTLDLYLLLGEIPEDAADTQTANGKPATRADAHDRLARMLCCDRTEFDAADADLLARFLADVQKRRLLAALSKVLAAQPEPCTAAVVSGSGSFLARQLLREHPRSESCRVWDLAARFGPAVAEAACAFAVASLCAEQVESPAL
jgi:hypothetical protein